MGKHFPTGSLERTEHLLEALHEAKAYAEKIIETVLHPLAVLNAEMTVLSVNRAFCELFKTTARRVGGKDFTSLDQVRRLKPRVSGRLRQIFFNQITLKKLPVEYALKGARNKKALLLTSQLFYRQQTPLLLVAMEDITERKKTEEALQEAHDLLEARIEARTRDLQIANAELLARTQEREKAVEVQNRLTNRLKIVSEIDHAILAAQSSKIIARVTLKGLERLIPYTGASILLFDYEKQCVRVVAAQTGTRIKVGERTVPLKKFNIPEALHPNDTKHRSIFARIHGIPEVALQSVQKFPLFSGNSMIGMLVICSSWKNLFVQEDYDIVEDISTELSVALTNILLFEELSAAHERLRGLSLRLEDAQQAERRSLARELHDEIGQALTGMKMLLERGRAHAPKPLDDCLKEVHGLATELLERVQKISVDLRPQLLDDLGLLPALEWHFRRYTKQTGIVVRFDHSAGLQRLSPHLERTVYRVVQEALTNVARYAKVEKANVRLWHENDYLGVQIQDTGTGFDAEATLASPESFGLAGMKERVTLWGGQFSLESAPGHGTKLTVELPVDKK